MKRNLHRLTTPEEGDKSAVDSGIACAERSPHSLRNGRVAIGEGKRCTLATNARLAR
jgi:hypothetical protein